MREATHSRRERRQSSSVLFYVHHEIYLRAILFFCRQVDKVVILMLRTKNEKEVW